MTGSAALAAKKYTSAIHAFQSGLEIAPEDKDLKRGYMEATRLAEKVSGTTTTAKKEEIRNGFDKKMMGMMMDLRYHSWVRSFWESLFVLLMLLLFLLFFC